MPPGTALIEHLKRLEELRQEIRAAGTFQKMKLAEEIGEASFKFAVAAAHRIVKLEEEIKTWKHQASNPAK